MKIIKRWLRNWVNNDNTIYATATTAGFSKSHDTETFGEPIRFSVTPARGGIVITSRTYDRQKDRTNEIIHVIHDDEDVARKVGDIVAMELIKA